ncbi:hypothetical protein [Onishia niordana]|nr:hypothetical protein [Halomonas niordiana]
MTQGMSWGGGFSYSAVPLFLADRQARFTDAGEMSKCSAVALMLALVS